ncbi:MAG: hypothetical protein WC100_20410 [Sterolibacterium sp.]
MPRESRNFWVVIASVLLLGAAVLFFIASETATQSGAVILRTGSALTALPQQDSAAPVSSSTDVQRMIDSGQFAPPPGNPDKMYSIASPFSQSAPAAPVTPGAPGKSQGNSGVQPGIAMLGANTWSNAPAQDARKSSSVTAEIKSHTAPAQVQSQSIEFETPPGIGSSKGGQ